MRTVLATTSSFGSDLPDSCHYLHRHGFNLQVNPLRRKLSEAELRQYLEEFRPVGLLAGLEEISAKTLSDAKSFLRVVSRVGAGMENVDASAAELHGIKVFRAADSVSPAVVELAIGLIFALARHVTWHDRLTRAGEWQKRQGILVTGKRVGVLGCGRIGSQLCLRMKALGCDVQGYDSFMDDAWFTHHGIYRAQTLDELYSTSDILSIHVPLTDGTRNILSVEAIAKIKTGALVVNTSRGALVDEAALYEALAAGKISGAALDVFANEPYQGPLATLENVILTPHIGSYAREVKQKMEMEAIDNLLLGLGCH